MKRSLFALTFVCAGIAASAVIAQAVAQSTARPQAVSSARPAASHPAAATVQAASGPEVMGPYTHDNFSVFLVADKNATEDEDVLTLDEALQKKVVTLKETGNVNELKITNAGKSKVFLQPGDIVKGGRQDRVLQHDTMLLPNSKDVSLDAFCVEAGRWQGRGNESSVQFSSSKNSLVTKEQRLAVKVAGSQSAVWSSVSKAQADMSRNLGKSVASTVSSTSLQLTLEDKKLEAQISTYVRAVEEQFPARGDVVGYAVAINGTVGSVDVFATPRLFNKLKGKLLRAGAAEAVAAKTNTPTKPPSVSAVQALLDDAESGPARAEKQTLRTLVSRKETPKSVVFSTQDDTFRGKAAHKSYMSK